MAATIFYNKKKLCYIDKADFTDFQPVGSDPMYKRYDSVYSMLQNNVDAEYRSFLTAPVCEDDKIYWWTEEWNELPRQLKDLSGEERARYERIKANTIKHYRDVFSKLELGSEDYFIMAGALKYINDDFIYCYDNKVYVVAWGMRPNENKMPVSGLWVKREKGEEKFNVRFDLGEGGQWEDSGFSGSFSRRGGVRLTKNDVPVVVNNDGYELVGWSPDPVGYEINGDVTFTALYDKLLEEPVCVEDEESPVLPPEEPPVPPKLPWYRRFRAWLKRNKWLKWLLLVLILLLLLFLLLRGCCRTEIIDPKPTDENIDQVYPIGKITDPDGSERDDNSPVGGIGDGDGGIVDDDGNLPDDDSPVVAPIFGGPAPAPIISDPEIPGNPQIIPNRLNIFFDDEDADMQEWYDEFKKFYPGEEYKLIGFDPNVPMLQIEIPEAERNSIREALPKQITSVSFFVVDETLIGQGGKISSEQGIANGWHLEAVHAEKAWEYTRGDEDIIIAVVDDGIDAGHPIFDGRIYNAYNVFTQDRRLSVGDGHGTHVAGLAAGNTKYLSKGAAGIAPNCKIMPVQVFDNDYCTFSSLASGIMYAIHNGANVINVSIGMSLPGLSAFPLEEQKKIARIYFRNEEKVYNHIFEVAKSKNIIIVFAAGNDNIMTGVLPECRSGETINVSAVTPEFKSTSFTNYEVGSTISAPGEAIYSSYPGNGFKSWDGTSMAAPIVTGAVALMLSVKPNATVDEIIGILQETGRKTDGKVPPMMLIDRALEKLMGIEVSSSDDDDYLNKLLELLKKLQADRDALDEQIDELIKQIEDAKAK